MTWLTSLSAGALVLLSIAFSLAIATASRPAVRAIVPTGERDHIHTIAAPLMPALGATFAVLMALTLASEAAHLRSAQDTVSTEAAQASRLAWAATSPGVDTAPIQNALTAYLRATRALEWHGVGQSEPANPLAADSLARMELAVRAEAAHAAIGTPTSTELLAALDGLTSARRDRLAAADYQLPALYVITLAASGAALIVNAGALTFRSSVRTSLLVIGLAFVVGLSMALLFALSGPWDGPLVVSGQPIDSILRDLDAGFFHA